MEKTKQKKTCVFVSVNSLSGKIKIIETINSSIDSWSKQTNTTPNFIPNSPIPNCSFWIDKSQQKCGLTISRNNARYGWDVDLKTKVWSPCEYMKGMFDAPISNGEGAVLFDIFCDYCSKFNISQTNN
jgi:hypothetical protein